MHLLLLTLALSSEDLPDAAQIEQLTVDLEAVQQAQADVVVSELTQCVAHKMEVLNPPDSVLGDPSVAFAKLESFLDQCGLNDASSQVKRLLRERSPEESEETIERRASAAFLFSVMALTALTNSTFEIEYEHAPEFPVEIEQP